MTKSPTLRKLTVLKRAEIGGVLSALATGIPMFIGHYSELQSTDYLSIFLKSFALPGAIISYPFYDPYRPPDILAYILLSLLYWFFFGFGLSLFIEDNSRATSWWLLLVLISSIVITLIAHSLVGIFQ